MRGRWTAARSSQMVSEVENPVTAWFCAGEEGGRQGGKVGGRGRKVGAWEVSSQVVSEVEKPVTV